MELMLERRKRVKEKKRKRMLEKKINASEKKNQEIELIMKIKKRQVQRQLGSQDL